MTCVKLREVFETKNALTFPVSATGMAGMERVVTNLMEPGDEVIVCVNGVFGTRMVDVMERAGATVHRIDVPWGEIIPDGVDDATVRTKLLKNYSIEIGAGLDPFAGKARRIGLMGHSATQANVDLVLAALKDSLS